MVFRKTHKAGRMRGIRRSGKKSGVRRSGKKSGVRRSGKKSGVRRRKSKWARRIGKKRGGWAVTADDINHPESPKSLGHWSFGSMKSVDIPSSPSSSSSSPSSPYSPYSPYSPSKGNDLIKSNTKLTTPKVPLYGQTKIMNNKEAKADIR